jgi:hypothetical protein
LRHLLFRSLLYSFTTRSIYPRFPLNISLCGLERGFLYLAGIDPGQVGFKTCNLFTTLTVLSRLPLLTISCFVFHTMSETLPGTALISTYFFAFDIETVSGWGKVGVTELKYRVVFMVKQLIYIFKVVWSDSLPATSDWHCVTPISFCKWTELPQPGASFPTSIFLHLFSSALKNSREWLLASSGLFVYPSIYPFVHPSVCTEQLGSLYKDFHYVLYLRIFRKSLKKIQVRRVANTLHEVICTFVIKSCGILLIMEIFQKKF